MEGGAGFRGFKGLTKFNSGRLEAVASSAAESIHPNPTGSPDHPSPLLSSNNDGFGGGAGGIIIREQDRFMPIANVIRIMRKVLPTHAKISDDAKETIQECVSEYISFITSEANERCQREQRKTITAEDVLWAMSKLGFDDYVEPLSVYLQRYRELEGDHRGANRGDPLPIKRSHSDISGTAAAAAAVLYGVPPATAKYQMVQPPPPQPPQLNNPLGVFGDGTTGYYLNVYGEGSGGAGSSSGQAPPMGGGGFDPYASFK